jgi:hypothetical protein
MTAQADAWATAAFGGRQAGILGPSVARPEPVRADFRRSSDADLRAMTDLELYTRETNLADVIIPAGTPGATVSEYVAERHNVTLEGTRRSDVDPSSIGGDEELPPGNSGDDEAEFAANKRQVAETTARNLEPGEDAASRARRDRIIANAIGGTLATFNTYLEREYGVQVANINANRDITIARLRNEDRAGDREYRLQLERYRNPGGGGGGGGGGGAGPVIGIGLLGLLLSMAKG